MGLTFGSLFAGIGGFDLGFERAGMECRWQVEIDTYCQKVLAKHWPDVGRWDDVRTFPPAPAEDWAVDVICGGFPCQDISVAGTGDGLDGERSGLWKEFHRIVCEIRPRHIVVENSAALLFRGLDRILGDLAGSGFDAEWRVYSASEFGAPHRRERLFIFANANEVDGEARVGPVANWTPQVVGAGPGSCIPLWLQAADRAPRVDDGIRFGAYRLRAESLGNSVLPQETEWIGRRIVEAFSPTGATR